jgi:hypothetical protein
MNVNKLKSKCMFCGSTAYGMGCAYSPHKRHVHISNGEQCIYCGSTSIGMGCPLNPFSKMHVRGVEYNNMNRESVHKTMMSVLFLKRLTEPISEMSAYKAGLIDKKGCLIREFKSDSEKKLLTPLDRHILKIRRLIGEDIIELFSSQILLELNNNIGEKFDIEQYKKEVELKSDINYLMDDIQKIFIDGNNKGFSNESIENFIIEAILKRHEDSQEE